MIDPRRVVVARYILWSDSHFNAASELGDEGDYGPEYDAHVQAAITLSNAATSELLAGWEDETVDERIRRYVGTEETRGWPPA